MRLINTRTMELEEFWSWESTPQYAVLSHTWGNPQDEATFQDMKLRTWSNPEEQYGYEKIRMTCELALEKKLEYAWIDTCCIDKTSSAELSESINSMFKWYNQATICFAYLADWESEEASFSHCKWFTRGWTLQELIAPKEVIFYDKTWVNRGNKLELKSEIYRACNVPENILTGGIDLSDIHIANRMSWAASRITSREEDMAYCLLGIFNVNMPMLYGEGKKAFIRLQEQLVGEYHDLSIFAWKQLQGDRQDFMGILAPSPKEFGGASGLYQTPYQRIRSLEANFSLSNRGIQFQAPL
ncbi:HET-domain-containing protein, partial [Periconia macrospinosa]